MSDQWQTYPHGSTPPSPRSTPATQPRWSQPPGGHDSASTREPSDPADRIGRRPPAPATPPRRPDPPVEPKRVRSEEEMLDLIAGGGLDDDDFDSSVEDDRQRSLWRDMGRW